MGTIKRALLVLALALTPVFFGASGASAETCVDPANCECGDDTMDCDCGDGQDFSCECGNDSMSCDCGELTDCSCEYCEIDDGYGGCEPDPDCDDSCGYCEIPDGFGDCEPDPDCDEDCPICEIPDGFGGCEPDPDCEGGEKCGGVDMYPGDACCNDSIIYDPNVDTCCGGEDVCPTCGEGFCCRTRNVCNPGPGNTRTPGGTCSDTEEVCAVSIVNSCSDSPGRDDCNLIDNNTCNYAYDYDGVVGCDDLERPLGGGTVYLSYTIGEGESCPSAEALYPLAQIAIAEALAAAALPDNDNDGRCDNTDPCDLCEAGEDCTPVVDEDIYDEATRDAAGLVAGSNDDCRCANGGEYDPVSNMCIGDLCSNLSGIQNQDFLDANPELTQAPDGLGGYACLCDGDPVDCQEGPNYCLAPGECCTPDQYFYCSASDSCIPNGTCCDGSCPGSNVCCAESNTCAANQSECSNGCLDLNQPAEYCTEIVGRDGFVLEPWATQYLSDESLGAFFQPQVSGQDFAQARADQDDCLNDPSLDSCRSIYGRVNNALAGATCSANVCDYGQECALYTLENGGTRATCVDAICDVCDEDGGCYDQLKCECQDPYNTSVTCCQADPNKPGYSASCVQPSRGVIIEVIPNIVNRGDSCFVLWATQGMESVLLEGDGLDGGVVRLFAGITEVTDVQVSSIYKIIGTGFDGETYEATDLCATNPSGGEF